MSEHFVLKNGVAIPAVGFGTYKATAQGPEALETAIKAGYRHFDTASFYGNEAILGETVRKSGIPRRDFFITTKLWKADMGYETTLRAAENSLKALGTDYLDLYLIHWPRPDLSADWRTLDAETWRAMEKLYEDGLCRAVGVSNFLVPHLENIERSCKVLPMVNQIEFHPGYLQWETVAYCHKNGILPEAWSPLGRGRVLNHPLLCEIAAGYGVSAAQLCVRFALQNGVLPLVKSTSAARIRENFSVFSFTITESDMDAIRGLPACGWSGEHPDRVRQAAQTW